MVAGRTAGVANLPIYNYFLCKIFFCKHFFINLLVRVKRIHVQIHAPNVNVESGILIKNLFSNNIFPNVRNDMRG